MKLELESYWIRLSNDEEPSYRITGKYLLATLKGRYSKEFLNNV